MPLQLAIHCHPESNSGGGGDTLNLALKLEQIASLLAEMKEGIVNIQLPEGESLNIDLGGIESLLGGLLSSVNGKLDAMASTNNAIKLSVAETNSLLNQINLSVSGIIGAVNSISTAVADNFSELFGRWDTIFGMIKSEFDETQLAIRETTAAQIQTTNVLTQIQNQLANKEVEEISKDVVINCQFDITNKIDVTIPAGAIAINLYFDYDDCKAVDVDRAAMQLTGERYLAVIKQIRKDGSEATKAAITPRVQGAWNGETKSIGNNISTKLPETHVEILKSHAVFTIEAIYAKVIDAEIVTVEIIPPESVGELGEEEIIDVPAEIDDTSAEETAPPAEETAPSADDAPADDAPADDAPADDAPADDAPADDAPADDAPAE